MCFLGLQLAGVLLSYRHQGPVAVIGVCVCAGVVCCASAVTITPPLAANPSAAGNEGNS